MPLKPAKAVHNRIPNDNPLAWGTAVSVAEKLKLSIARPASAPMSFCSTQRIQRVEFDCQARLETVPPKSATRPACCREPVRRCPPYGGQKPPETAGAAAPTNVATKRLFRGTGSSRRSVRRLRRRALRSAAIRGSAVFKRPIQRIANEGHHPAVIRIGERVALDQRQLAAE